MKKELIHARQITLNCYETGAGHLVVEGFLKDERLFPSHLSVGGRREAGPMHHVAMTMELTVPELRIVTAEAQMPVVPEAGCRDIEESVRKLSGRAIQPGFTHEVRGLFGKTAGCLHLTNLILAMSSAAVQGLWCLLSRVREGDPRPLAAADGSMLIDSCHMWRQDGPFAERFRRRRTDESNHTT